MEAFYDQRLVALSVVVAIFASYTALDLAGRVSDSRWENSLLWLVGGGISMGLGIWSMHFIGMLAFHLPIRVSYDLSLTLLSMVIAVGSSFLALWVVKRPALTLQNLSVGAMLMGAGIASMHYTGMYAMRMSPAIEYHAGLFMASVLIAIGASLAALWIAFQLRHRQSLGAVLAKHGSAVLMGLAITGMHYTGMAAADFAPGSVCLAADSTGGMATTTLAMTIGMITLGIMALTLVLSSYDAHVAVQNAKLASSLQAANDQLRNMALYDALTGLPNRSLLDDRMDHALRISTRNREHFALLFVDLDRFKPVNDVHGHLAGDELLRQVARRLTACVRQADTVARTGGDEFIIVLERIRHPSDAAEVSQKIVGELSRPFAIDRLSVDISCSIGISVFPEHGTDVNSLILNADKAMYSAKQHRNSFQFFNPSLAPNGAH